MADVACYSIYYISYCSNRWHGSYYDDSDNDRNYMLSSQSEISLITKGLVSVISKYRCCNNKAR